MLARTEAYTLGRLKPESLAFEDMVEASRREGFWMLVRLRDGIGDGGNLFSRRGEILLGAYRDTQLVGVCGLNVDPYVETHRLGRVRHLYVDAAHRRAGVGRLLVETVVERAKRHFPVLNVRAPESAFPFYEALGFGRVEGEEFHTHRLQFRRPRAIRRDKAE
jgi:GNAT superfamily N-acetyltransferase